MNEKIFLAFDIDGTIYDAGDILEEAFAEAILLCTKQGLCKESVLPSKESIVATLGFPIDKICSMLFPHLPRETRDYLGQKWTENLVYLIKDKKGKLIEGVEEVIPQLFNRGYELLVASNGVRAYIEAILFTYNLTQFFSPFSLYAEGDLSNKSEIIAEYKKILKSSKIIMIGDRITDLDAARLNNLPFIGCAFGHAGAEEISGQKFIASKFTEILDLIESIVKSNSWFFI
ncbi:MAG: bifunctional 5'-methylthioadenosine/S-adenosylhomocysteine nucleosidase/phosphatase [Spirochaetes bacterium ADurb.Bin218]|jgi:phosphoglycolate phosphatase-like HAD superfamily hydrolase|nr:MAG: bifunctional 5'-methylthioadenosine/S-adenosylhomocysteine nucleosidase/phosphatase [Spirochaetes bacterium ADurb.Bin218]